MARRSRPARWTHPVVVLAALVLVGLAVLAVIGPILWGGQAEQTDVLSASQGASGAHPFGTDTLGRDLLARTLAGTRLSLLLAVTAAVLGMALGIPLGVVPAVLGPRWRRLVAGAIGAAIALPGLLLALFVNTVIGIGAAGAVLGIGVANAPTIARLAQTLTAGVAAKDYVAASRMLGTSRLTLLRRHILPNVAEPLILTGTMSVGWCLLEISALSFLGLGVRPPDYDWGSLLKEGLESIYVNPMGALGPGLFVIAGGLGFALLGEALSGVVAGTPPPPSSPPPSDIQARAAVPSVAGAPPVLDIQGLTVRFPTADGGWATVVDDVDLRLEEGQTLGIVGESGSGKTMTVRAIAQLVDHPGHVDAARMLVAGTDPRDLAPGERRALLGTRLAMVSQDPLTALNPALRVGGQLAEVGRVHAGLGRGRAWEAAVAQLERVHLDDPARRARQFPHEFSGGMRQRAVIGMGLMAQPSAILADEPTTALDVTVQQQVLGLLSELNREDGTAIVLISHDLAVVTDLCDRVAVMYAGRVVEEATAAQLVDGPAHPYSQALLAAVPGMDTDVEAELVAIPGRPPGLGEVPQGCAFAPRCPLAQDRCREDRPPLVTLGDGRQAACWFAGEDAVLGSSTGSPRRRVSSDLTEPAQNGGLS